MCRTVSFPVKLLNSDTFRACGPCSSVKCAERCYSGIFPIKHGNVRKSTVLRFLDLSSEESLVLRHPGDVPAVNVVGCCRTVMNSEEHIDDGKDQQRRGGTVQACRDGRLSKS